MSCTPPPPNSDQRMFQPPGFLMGMVLNGVLMGKNEIYNRENLLGPFLVHKLLGPRAPLHSNTFLPMGKGVTPNSLQT